MSLALADIPAEQPFLPTLARAWIAQAGEDPDALGRGLILVPTRRAARALADAFLAEADGRALLLPRIAALGALDEAKLALQGALALPQPLPEAERLVRLTRLILAFDGEAGVPRRADGAWVLAGELAALLDEAAREEVDLPAALPGAAAEAYAAHWGRILRFLEIVTRQWPAILAESGFADPAQRQAWLLDAQAKAWEAAGGPDHPVWAAGFVAPDPALARLLRAIARLPQGLVVVQGLDRAMPDAAWDAPGASHPQDGMRRLLNALGARREDCQPFPGTQAAPGGRFALLGRALLPAEALATGWRVPPEPAAIAGLALLRPEAAQEEAAAIALVLRAALETPGQQAGLVTPDRALAQLVSAELLRFGVVVDDSAGEALAETPPAIFLRLLAQAVAEDLAPVALLALLKHPFAAAGLPPAACREAARALELAVLRGPRPAPGIAGLRGALNPDKAAHTTPLGLVARLEAALGGFIALMAQDKAPPAALFTALIAAAEALATTDATPGAEILWAEEEGAALSAHLAGLLDALPELPPQPPDTLCGLLEATLAGAVLRSRRALRGRDGAEHPRIAIWGPLEARLQSADLLVLAGLTETMWPPATDPGPWLSRPMRAAIGLPSPETRIGQAARDFTLAACAAPQIVLSCPIRRDGAPMVPARWLARLEAYLGMHGVVLPAHPALGWARLRDLPAGPPQPVAPPRPCPPMNLRPRRLRVTDIETWFANPYAIYARHVLGLRPLDALDQPMEASDYGTIVHRAMEIWVRALAQGAPIAADRLRDIFDAVLSESAVRPALAAWWRPRLHRIAEAVAAQEAARVAAKGTAPLLLPEIDGDWQLAGPAGPFRLVGRADRVEWRAEGISILDYKTGSAPARSAVQEGRAPQLLLEAAMIEAGAFPGLTQPGPVTELQYWRMTGGREATQTIDPFAGTDAATLPDAVAQMITALRGMIAAFDDPGTVYLAHPNPAMVASGSDYDQLARMGEWANTGGASE